MESERALIVFQGKNIRRIWYTEEWFFSVVDIIAILTEQEDHLRARKYWNKLRQRLGEEGSEVVTDCHRLKMRAPDGKMRLTDEEIQLPADDIKRIDEYHREEENRIINEFNANKYSPEHQ
ncbi:MAG: hypothetical protein ABIJ21_08790 [Nanoarchaeota archaeon]